MIIRDETDMSEVAKLVVGELAKSRMQGKLAEMQRISESVMIGFLAGYFAGKQAESPEIAIDYQRKILLTHPLVLKGVAALKAKYG